MFSLFDKVLPRTAPAKDQRQQLEELKQALTDARARLREAQDAFDADGTPAAKKAREKAQEVEAEALAYLGRAERNLAAAEAAEAEAERNAKRARVEELKKLIADRRVDDELAAAEAKAWLDVERRRADRRAQNISRNELERELLTLLVALNGPDAAERFPFTDREPSVVPVARALELEVGRQKDPARRGTLHTFVQYLTSGRW